MGTGPGFFERQTLSRPSRRQVVDSANRTFHASNCFVERSIVLEKRFLLCSDVSDGQRYCVESVKKAGSEGLDHTKNETDLRIELINGSTIELKGTENAMALRGRSLSGVVLDEAAFMDSEVWFEVIRPALADKEGWALFISTPDGTASWFYDLWCYVPEDETKEWQRWSYTTIEGGNVSKQEVEAARAQRFARSARIRSVVREPHRFGRYQLSDDNISPDAKDISIQPLLLGVDFNVDPMSGICAVKDADTLYVFDEIMLTGGATTWDFAEEVTRRYGVDRRIIACLTLQVVQGKQAV